MGKYKIDNDNKALIVELAAEKPAIPYWQIAQRLGVHENTLSRMMRVPNDDQTERIVAAIESIRAAQS